MAKFKLPESLKAWKVVSSLPDNNGHSVFEVSRKETDGSVTRAVLTYVAFQDDEYNSDNVQFVNEEASFIRNVISCGDISNYIDAAVLDRPSKSKVGMFIITQKLPSLDAEMAKRQFSEDDITDFGLQMSEILSKLETRGIFHGNIKPSNIYVTPDGAYKLGGFTDFESSISDLSYISPEIKAEEQPDFTTDIYSVGLIMYSMSNNGSIPFEDENTSREDAIQKRFNKQSVTAPKNGSEKLKSVIVIACQPDKANRWKNAGNLKNALASIKAEADAKKTPEQEIIPPAPTEFSGNVFEEFVYDEFEEAEPEPKTEAEPEPKTEAEPEPKTEAEPEPKTEAEPEKDNPGAAEAAAAVAGIAAVGAAAGAAANAGKTEKNLDKIKEAIKNNGKSAEETQEIQAEATPQKEPEPEKTAVQDSSEEKTQLIDAGAPGNSGNGDNKAEEPKTEAAGSEIDNRVFDDYQVQTKVFNISDVTKKSDKDYGDYFDDEPEPVSEEKSDRSAGVDNEFGKNGFYDDNSFYSEQNEEQKRSRKGMVISIIVFAAVVALLAVLGVLAVTSGWFGNGNTKETQPSTEVYTEDTTAQKATTQPVTTVPPTTAPALSTYEYPVNVVGAYYDYAKSVLEEQGYKVVEGEYADSEEFDEGIVTSMDPGPDNELEKGSTITLNISSGRIESGGSDNNSDENNDGENDYYDDNDYNDYDDGEYYGDEESQSSENTGNGENSESSESGDNNRRSRGGAEPENTSYSQYKNNTSYMSQSEVNNMSRSELNLALNEIYARRGRIFNNSSLSSYFNAQSWYTPKYSEEEFAEKVTFNDYENKNIQMILDAQMNKGYR